MSSAIKYRILACVVVPLCLLCFGGLVLRAASPASLTTPRAALQAVPSDDGQSIVILAGRLGTVATPISATLTVGPTSHEPGHTDYDPDEDQYAFRFDAVAMPGQSWSMDIALTTSDAGGLVDLGAASFVREYLDGQQVDEIVSLDQRVTVRVPASAAQASNYWVLMKTMTPPADPPPSYRALGSSYSLWGSGFVTGTQSSLLLTMYYDPAWLNSDDANEVALFWRDAAADAWQEVPSQQAIEAPGRLAGIHSFGIYALMEKGSGSHIYLPLILAAPSSKSAARITQELGVSPSSESHTSSANPAFCPGPARIAGEGDSPWQPTGRDQYGVGQLYIPPSDPSFLYAGTEVIPDGLMVSSGDLNVWTSINEQSRGFAVHPNDRCTVYVGVWKGYEAVEKTVNCGQSWVSLEHGGGEPTSIAIDPLHPNTVYVGTKPSTKSAGVYRSTNGGLDWVVALPDVAVTEIVVSPWDAGVVLAGAKDSGGTLGGVFRSANGGISWTKVFTASEISAFAVDPVTPQIIYLGTKYSGVLKSTDAGITWNPVTVGLSHLYVRALVVNPKDTRMVFAGTWEGGVYRSLDAGAHWSPMNEGLVDTYVLSLAIDPMDAAALYVGTEEHGVLKKTLIVPPPPAGTTYVHVTQTTSEGYKPVMNACVYRNGQIVTGPDGSPARTDAGGYLVLATDIDLALCPGSATFAGDDDSPWTSQHFSNYTWQQLEVDRDDPDAIIAATDTYIEKSTDGGLTWSILDNGRGSPFAVDPTNKCVMYDGGGWKTVDCGETWHQLPGWCGLSWSSIAIDPQHPDIIYMGNGDLYKAFWGGLECIELLDRSDISNISDIIIDPRDTNRLYIGARGSWNGPPGGIFRSVDAGVTWTKLMTNTQLNTLAVDPSDSQILYAGTRFDGVLKSSDGGQSWSQINTGLPYTNVLALVVNPRDSNNLYIGTNGVGVYRSTNGGTSWEPFNDGLSNPYIYSLAIDPTGGAVLYAGPEESGLFRRSLLAEAPPGEIPFVHVTQATLDGDKAIKGACIYRNGQIVRREDRTPARTDAGGYLVLDAAQPGDTLVAVAPFEKQPTSRAGHDEWSYWTNTTSLNIAEDGAVSGYQVTAAGAQELQLNQPLVLFNLVVSLEWDAQPEYIAQMERALRKASDYLFDVTDGQMAFGQVSIYDDKAHWDEADIQVLARNDVRPHAYIGGLTSDNPAHTIRVGRYWSGSTGAQGAWDEQNGYRTLIHEFGHYALSLADSYFRYTFDGNGDAVGQSSAACTGLNLADAVNASIMDHQYGASELAAFGTPGLWETMKCVQTAQWQLNQESDWQTVVRNYRDPEEPARWQFNSPLDSFRVMSGPAELPLSLLPFPSVSAVNAGQSAPSRSVTVLTRPEGPAYTQNALVALQHKQGTRWVTLDQGLTRSTGQIEILGAIQGDELRVLASDGSRSVRQVIGAATQYTVSLGTSTAQAAGAGMNPFARILPSADCRILAVGVSGVGADAALAATFVPPGGYLAQNATLAYTPANGDYEGSFEADTPGLGSVHVRGVAAAQALVALDSDFLVSPVQSGQVQDFYAPGGAVWVHLNGDSLAAENGCFTIMPAGAVPQPLPSGRVAVGNAYSLHVSGGLATLDRPGVLRLFYDPALLMPGVRAQDLTIARWDGAAWQPLADSTPDPERNAITAQFDRLGTYMLLGPAVEQTDSRSVYLPLLMQ